MAKFVAENRPGNSEPATIIQPDTFGGIVGDIFRYELQCLGQVIQGEPDSLPRVVDSVLSDVRVRRVIIATVRVSSSGL